MLDEVTKNRSPAQILEEFESSWVAYRSKIGFSSNLLCQTPAYTLTDRVSACKAHSARRAHTTRTIRKQKGGKL